jgi:DegV family protein with EDD domain
MSDIAIVTDSTAALPKELIEKHGIKIVPNSVVFGNKAYLDGIDLIPQDFYTLFEQAKDLPTVSAASPGPFADAFLKAAEEGASSIVCILVSSGLSAAQYKSVSSAKESCSQIPIEVVDSLTTGGSLGFVVMAAARAAADGKPLPEVIKAAEDMKKQVNNIFVLDTIKYLARSGRIGNAASWATSLLSIKPIIEIPTSTGNIEPLERTRAKLKALNRLVEIMGERVGMGRPVHVAIQHGNAPDGAEWLKEQLLSRFDCTEIYINDCSLLLTVQLGPGVISLAFYTEGKLQGGVV